MNQRRRLQKRSSAKFANSAEVGAKILDHANGIPSKSGSQIGSGDDRDISFSDKASEITAQRATDSGFETFAIEVVENSQQHAFRPADNACMVHEENLHR